MVTFHGVVGVVAVVSKERKQHALSSETGANVVTEFQSFRCSKVCIMRGYSLRSEPDKFTVLTVIDVETVFTVLTVIDAIARAVLTGKYMRSSLWHFQFQRVKFLTKKRGIFRIYTA